MNAPCVLAIGNFDGVHAGHKHLLRVAKEIAVRENLPLQVLTFWPHPRTVLRPDRPHRNLMDAEARTAALRQNGVDDVHTLTFDTELAALSPAEFVQNILVGKLRARHVVIGENFRYGYKAQGTPVLLATEPAFTTHVMPLLADEKGVLSSTRLRAEVL